MERFLLFTLYAPLAACGEIAVGERRMGWNRPARSAVLGLVAAALGLERDDEAAHDALEAGYGYAVRTDAIGRPFVDYHTIQVAPRRRGQHFDTRRAELSADRLETVLSYREYRSDALYTAALWMRAGAPHDLAELEAAIARPRFTLYLGRKSAPLGLPLHPELIEANGLLSAFAERSWPSGLTAFATAEATTIAFDLDAPGLSPDQIEHRRDAIGSRRRWQFALREEGVVTLRPDAATP